VTFAPGQKSTTVSISVFGDTVAEPDENVVVSFHDPTGGGHIGGTWGLGKGTITNDD
jgi:hypothetical protein